MISIDDRMKDYYEKRNRHYLIRRMPVIIRLDGKAFHTYTKGLDKPFDQGLIEDMQQTTLYLCQNIQGCVFGYTQSDEISLLLIDYDTLKSEAWFDYCQDKMESVAASMATAKFNQLRLARLCSVSAFDESGNPHKTLSLDEIQNNPLAFFDARAFNIPKEDAANHMIWRQQDATKNSISMLAQSLYSYNELHGKSGNEKQEMCWKKGINWNDLPTSYKRGTAVYKQRIKKSLFDKVSIDQLNKQRNADLYTDYKDGNLIDYGIWTDDWKVDYETPIFSQKSILDNVINP